MSGSLWSDPYSRSVQPDTCGPDCFKRREALPLGCRRHGVGKNLGVGHPRAAEELLIVTIEVPAPDGLSGRYSLAV